MRILVTGGAGFIGGHVVRRLLHEGAEVRVLDSFVSGRRENVPPEAVVIEGDIRDARVLEAAMRGMTHVVHLAAQVSVPASMQDPRLTHDVNIEGTKAVLAAAARAGVARFVYASSAAVYGDHPELPKAEESPLEPKSPYAESKVVNERDARESGLSTLGLRFFNVYGPGQAADHPYASVIPRWVAAARAGRTIELYGDGSQTRDFIHVHDVTRAVTLALSSTYVGVCNIASGTETPLLQVLEYLNRGLGREVAYEVKPVRAGDIRRSVAQVDRARREIGFSAEVPLVEGLRDLFI